MAPLVSMKNVSVRFDDRDVLDNISLDINAAEITTIIGPNGAGKSTLIKALLGLVTPYKGKIKKKRKLTLGYVPQKLKLNDTLPLHVDRFLKLAGKYSQQERSDALKLVGAEHLASNDMHRLSGGESQRVMIAAALAQQTPVMLLDEPTSSLDAEAAKEAAEAQGFDNREFGFWLYLMSDAVLFSLIFVTFVVMSSNLAGGPGGADLFDIKSLATQTALLP